MVKRSYNQYCPVANALDLVGERWTLLIVRELLVGPKRFTDLLKNLPGIGTNLLAARLKELEENKIMERITLPPPAASQVYILTELGRGLEPAITELWMWGSKTQEARREQDQFRPGWMVFAMKYVDGVEKRYAILLRHESCLKRRGHADDVEPLVSYARSEFFKEIRDRSAGAKSHNRAVFYLINRRDSNGFLQFIHLKVPPLRWAVPRLRSFA